MKECTEVNLHTTQWETFEGENFHNFCGFVAIHESFLYEIWGRGVLWRGKTEQSTKVFLAKVVYFTNLRKFTPLKVSRYTVYVELKATVCYIWISAHVNKTTTLRTNTTTSSNHT